MKAEEMESERPQQSEDKRDSVTDGAHWGHGRRRNTNREPKSRSKDKTNWKHGRQTACFHEKLISVIITLIHSQDILLFQSSFKIQNCHS